MFENHSLGLIAVTATLMGGSLLSAPIAQADATPYWGGLYKITFHTEQKSGTSMAARQTETPYKDNVSRSIKFDWTGSDWSRSNSWNWDCL